MKRTAVSDRGSSALLLLDVAAKAALVACLVLVVVNPSWGNLEGKAPFARAVIYPLLAGVVPLLWWFFMRRRPFPWAPDLFVTLVCFSDILGNRLDLYDRIVWFDDFMHYASNILIGAAAVLLTLHPLESMWRHVERAVAISTTASLAWELFEYLSFVTKSREYPMAYSDTLGDFALGWLGASTAGVAVHAVRSRHAPTWEWIQVVDPGVSLTTREPAAGGRARFRRGATGRGRV